MGIVPDNDYLRRIQIVRDLQKESGEILEKIDLLENDPLFVACEEDTSGFEIHAKTYYEWFYDNDIIAKYENFDFSISGVLHLSIIGFRFKSETDATAFKLRWT